ncbi:MAG TPA: MFS transporter [Candidatus Micrarchaeota archaeon]|nr:MFS transporter [Candidatus Micrarchaeota archaeon]
MFGELNDLRHVSKFKRGILPLSIVFFIYTFGWGMTAPIFSIYVQNVTGNLFMTGVVLSMTTMMGIFLNIPFGLLMGRVNVKRVLQAVLLAYAALAVLYPAAGTLQSLLLVSIARGILSSILWLVSWACIFAYVDKGVKGKEVGFFSDMNDLASALSPMLGGLAAALSFFLPFYLLALTSLIAFAAVTVYMKEVPRPKKAPLKTQMSALLAHARDNRFVKTVFLIVLFYALINVYYAFLAVFLHGQGIPIATIGVMLTVALLPAVALEVPMGNLADKYGVGKSMAAAAFFAMASGMLLPLSGNVYLTAALVTAFTVSYTMIFIALYARMSDIMGKGKTAMTGAMATFKDLGYTLGPLAAGLMMGVVGIQGTFIAAGALFALLIPMALSLHD